MEHQRGMFEYWERFYFCRCVCLGGVEGAAEVQGRIEASGILMRAHPAVEHRQGRRTAVGV